MIHAFDLLDQDITCEYKDTKDPKKTVYHPNLQPLSTDNLNGKFFHSHDGYEFLLVLDGEYFMETEHGNLSLRMGDLLLLPPYLFHRGEPKHADSYKRIVINVKTSYWGTQTEEVRKVSTLLLGDTLPSVKKFTLNDKELDFFVREATQMQTAIEEKHEGNKLFCQACLHKICVLLLHLKQHNEMTTSEENNLLHCIFKEIDNRISQKVILSELANDLHYNRDYLCRYFKKQTGLSLKQYCIEKKIGLAQKYLQEGKTPGEVCQLVGFENYANFSRTFSKQVGQSPMEVSRSLPKQRQ